MDWKQLYRTVKQKRPQTYKLVTQKRLQEPRYKEINVMILRDVVDRVNAAYRSFLKNIEKKKNGEKIKVSRPEKKKIKDYNSFVFVDQNKKIENIIFKSSNELEKSKYFHIRLGKIGNVKAIIRRKKYMNILRGIIKEIAVKKEVDKWFAVLTFEIDNEQINDNFNNTVNNDVIGIDLGIKTFVTFSNGKKIDCPKYFTEMSSTLSELQSEIDNLRNEIKKLSKEISELGKSEENINLLQERLELAKKNFFKKKRKYSLLYKKIVNKRNDFIFKTVLEVLREPYKYIACEDLNVEEIIQKNVKENSIIKLHKYILDASWRKFINVLKYKAEEKNKKVLFVDPRYTSQDCPYCKHREKHDLDERRFTCKGCGKLLDRDIAAAMNIRDKGREMLAALTNTSILATNINANIENKEKEVSVLDKQEGHTIIDSEQ